MAEANACLFCDHALDGRSAKFCTTCLPPLAHWPSQREYAKRYNDLYRSCGLHPDGGFPSCRIPESHGAYSPQGPVHGPRLSDRPLYGPPKPNRAKFTPDQHEAAIQAEADRLFPRQTYERFFVNGLSRKTDRKSVV